MGNMTTEKQAAKSVNSIDWLAIINAQTRYDLESSRYYGDPVMEPIELGDYIHYDDLMAAINAAIQAANTET
jgi:hypothetical protein